MSNKERSLAIDKAITEIRTRRFNGGDDFLEQTAFKYKLRPETLEMVLKSKTNEKQD